MVGVVVYVGDFGSSARFVDEGPCSGFDVDELADNKVGGRDSGGGHRIG